MFTKLRFEFVCQAEKAELKGKCKNNLIRSTFGASLWKEDKPAYYAFFEGRLMEGFGGKKFAFFSPECFETKRVFKKGEIFSFQIVFVGLNTFWADIYPAFVKMLEQAGFSLLGVYAMSSLSLLDQPEESAFVGNGPKRVTTVPEFEIEEILNYRIEQPIRELEIQLVTPVRLERGGELIENPSFADIVFACSRRVDNLFSLFLGQVKVPKELSGLPEASLAIQSAGVTEWQDWYRKKSKNKKEENPPAGGPMVMGGAIGTVKAEKNQPPYLNPYLPLLLAGQCLHIGKAITMGNGLIRVKW